MEEQTQALVIIEENSIPLADSRQIAQELGIEHRSFFSLITEYQQEIEEDFGSLRFQIAVKSGNRGGAQPRYALLTEDQTYAYLAYSKNTEQARACKRKLVKAFSAARTMLQQVALAAPAPVFPQQLLNARLAMSEWLEQGEDNAETDALFQLMRYEFSQVTPEDEAQWKVALKQLQKQQALLLSAPQDVQEAS